MDSHFSDDIEPSFDGGDQEYHAKGNAAVHIKVTLKENITKETVTPEKSKTSTWMWQTSLDSQYMLDNWMRKIYMESSLSIK